MAMQDDIRYLAKEHGVDNLTDEQVKELQTKLACALVDQWLDNSQLSPKPTIQTPENSHDGKEKCG
jgi:hypothetical protein